MKYIFCILIIAGVTLNSCTVKQPQFETTLAIDDFLLTAGQIDTAVIVLKKRLNITQPNGGTVRADYNNRQIKIKSAALDKEWVNDHLLKKGALVFYECFSIAGLAVSLQQADKTVADKLTKTKKGSIQNPFMGTFYNIAQPYQSVYGQKFPPNIGYVLKENITVMKNYFAHAKDAFPPGTKMLFKEESENRKNEKIYAVYFVKDDDSKIVAINHITTASASLDNKYPSVRMQFDAYGSYVWKRMTTANINKNIAIVIDDDILNAPNVNGSIEGGNTEISGVFTIREAQDIATILRSGFLPLNLKLISTEQVKGVK
jgi:hypothetical protein